MEYAKLGNTDIEVSKVCVGCMSFGKAGTMHDWTRPSHGQKSSSETVFIVIDGLKMYQEDRFYFCLIIISIFLIHFLSINNNKNRL